MLGSGSPCNVTRRLFAKFTLQTQIFLIVTIHGFGKSHELYWINIATHTLTHSWNHKNWKRRGIPIHQRQSHHTYRYINWLARIELLVIWHFIVSRICDSMTKQKGKRFYEFIVTCDVKLYFEWTSCRLLFQAFTQFWLKTNAPNQMMYSPNVFYQYVHIKKLLHLIDSISISSYLVLPRSFIILFYLVLFGFI